MANRLSVIIISKNEALNIQECLRSVSFADERIVVDSGSNDGTVELARAEGATVIQTPDWPGFGPQKTRALNAAAGNWILSLDADERVTSSLRAELLAVMNLPDAHVAYRLPRLSNFCGKWIWHSGWYPDYIVRFFQNGHANFTADLVHESIKVQGGNVGTLKNPLLHYSYRTHQDCLRKLTQYSTLGAEQTFAKGRKSSLTKALAFASIDFCRMYILRRGFLDGRAGLIIALLSAESMYQKYLGLALLNEGVGSSRSLGDPPPPEGIF